MTDNNTRNGNLVFLGIVVATAAVLFLQYLGKTTIRDDCLRSHHRGDSTKYCDRAGAERLNPPDRGAS